MTISIILAGGLGERFGILKQFIPICKKPIFIHTLEKFENYPRVLVVPSIFSSISRRTLLDFGMDSVIVVDGGLTRQESVFNALKYIKKESETVKKVLITDANRPLISKTTIEKVEDALDKHPAVVTVAKSVNTSCVISDNSRVENVLDRTRMYEMLMPQGFWFDELYSAHSNTTIENATDDSQLMNTPRSYSISIPYWEGVKLTVVEDYEVISTLLRSGK